MNPQLNRLPSATFLTLRLCLFAFFLGALPLSSMGQDNPPMEQTMWREDAQKALQDAQAQKKDLVFLFTGSDWCPPCKKLHEEVLSQPGFQREASPHYILVKFDFPKEKELPAKLKSQNEQMAKKYGVEAYPTVIFVDSNTLPYGIAGYEPGGVENYLAILEEFRQARILRDEKFEAAKAADGVERARLLDQGLSGIDEMVANVYYEKVIAEITELDKDDEAGLRSKWNAAKESELRKIIMTDVLLISRLEKPEKAIQFIDEVMKEFKFPSDEKISLLQIKLNLIRNAKDVAGMNEVLDEMINLEGANSETRERLIVKKILLMVGVGKKGEALKLLERSITPGEDNMHLYKAKGDILESTGDFEKALVAYESAEKVASNAPDVLVEVIAAKADVLFASEKAKEAMQALDNFAENTNMPSDLRSATLLHKAMMMRETDRRRQARLAENRAIEIAESTAERGEVEKMVQRLRAKYDDN